MKTSQRLSCKLMLFTVVVSAPVLGSTIAHAQTAPTDSILLTRDDGNVYRTNASGSTLVSITNKSAGTQDHDPSWSPDGGYVAFERTTTSGGQPGLYVKNLSSGTEERLAATATSPSGERWTRNPTWGPQQYIAYQDVDANGCIHLIQWPQRSSRTLCPPVPDGDKWWSGANDLTWSANGTDLYVNYTYITEGSSHVYETVYQINPATGQWTELYDSVASGMDRQYSDGLLSPAGTSAIYSNGYDPIFVSFSVGDFPALDPGSAVSLYSRDGSRIAYGKTGGLWQVDSDGVSQRQQILGTSGTPIPKAWSHDQTRLLFGTGSTDATVINLLTGAQAQLPAGHYDRNAWSRH